MRRGKVSLHLHHNRCGRSGRARFASHQVVVGRCARSVGRSATPLTEQRRRRRRVYYEEEEWDEEREQRFGTKSPLHCTAALNFTDSI